MLPLRLRSGLKAFFAQHDSLKVSQVENIIDYSHAWCSVFCVKTGKNLAKNQPKTLIPKNKNQNF